MSRQFAKQFVQGIETGKLPEGTGEHTMETDDRAIAPLTLLTAGAALLMLYLLWQGAAL